MKDECAWSTTSSENAWIWIVEPKPESLGRHEVNATLKVGSRGNIRDFPFKEYLRSWDTVIDGQGFQSERTVCKGGEFAGQIHFPFETPC